MKNSEERAGKMEENKGTQPQSKFQQFLKRKNIEISTQRYAIEGFGAMAQGLFASLLIGTIFNTIGTQTGWEIFNTIGGFAMAGTGAAMAISIAMALKAPPFVIFAMAGIGLATNKLGGAGGPLAVYFITVFATEAGKIVSKETKIDLIVTPGVTLIVGILLALWWAPPIGAAASKIGDLIMWATNLQPFMMGVLVSVIVGITLTLPISSAAICAALSLVGLAGGAAVAGCCAHMVGFAVMSYPENKFGGLMAQGIGTSMLQVPNLVRNPYCWLPPVIASAITGPLATCIFNLKMNGAAISSGMGTSGLVGPIGVISGWFAPVAKAVEMGESVIVPTPMDWWGVALICFILPALLTWLIAIPFRRSGLIKFGDLKIDC